MHEGYALSPLASKFPYHWTIDTLDKLVSKTGATLQYSLPSFSEVRWSEDKANIGKTPFEPAVVG